MNQATFSAIMELLPYGITLLLSLFGVIFGKAPITKALKSKSADKIFDIAELVYFAVKNLKRNYAYENGEKMDSAEVKRLFRERLFKELKNRGIEPTTDVIEQAERYIDTIHAQAKTENVSDEEILENQQKDK